MRCGQLGLQLLPLLDRYLAPEKFAEVEPDPHALDSDETRDVFDVVDITVEGRIFLCRADEDRVDPDHAATRTNHSNLLVADVALDVVKAARVGVRDDKRFGR